ncbi:MAG: class I SAM-dependent methyltransferase [Alphaproteobacteria bacterium]|nr:class I SAM-dependent methyltransferase [Alphaproteobacteria bacterium]
MAILVRLTSIYERLGFDISTGLNPTHVYGEPVAPFTYLFQNGEAVNSAAGIAVQELYFLEALAGAWQPRHILIVGNSFGWSAVAMALAFPGSRVLAIDSGDDVFTVEGLALTNRIASEEGLSNLLAVRGHSPTDIERLAHEHAKETPWDMLFIDGEHTPLQVAIDFAAARPFASPEALWLFHDAISFSLLSAVEALGAEHGLVFQPLWRTPSGIAALVPQSLVTSVAPVLHAFAGSEQVFRHMRDLGRYGSGERLLSSLRCPEI